MVFIMEKLKPWLFSILPNLLFFGFCGGAIVWEASLHITTKQTGDAFLVLLPIYIIFYAFFTYKNTRKILLPLISFFVFLYTFLLLTDYLTAAFSGFYTYSTEILTGVMIIFGIFTLVPTLLLLVIQFIFKWVLKKLNK